MKLIVRVVFLMMVVVGGLRAQEPLMRAGIFAEGPNTVVVKAKPVGAGLNGVFSAMIVSVFWETSAGLSITGMSSSYGLVGTSTGTVGGLTYQVYGMVAVPGYTVDWAAGSEQPVLTVTFEPSVPGPVVIMLQNPPVSANGDWYFEAKAQDLTDNGSPFYAPSTELALPVTISSFAARPVHDGRAVTLEWTTLSEVNNYGFTVQRRREEDVEFEDLCDSFVPGHGTTIEARSYSFTDNTLPAAGDYVYRLKQSDLDGTVHFSATVLVHVMVTSVSDPVPRQFQLMQNYPNPFNPETSIMFTLETPGHATLRVYSAAGAEVATLFNGTAEAGWRYQLVFDGRGLSSGMYFTRLSAGGKTQVRAMLLLR
ncbi:MAG: T9SS type A sorting domain-containing protein [Bacteroidetes bacterium]|nr:T9SS type A sorting domain-containing protein [Bacteroidota bacterium]